MAKKEPTIAKIRLLTASIGNKKGDIVDAKEFDPEGGAFYYDSLGIRCYVEYSDFELIKRVYPKTKKENIKKD